MAASDDLVDFDLIEGQKENIQSLPGGRSAKKLAQLYSPSPLQKLSTPTPLDTKNVSDCIRAEYEAEVLNISESDDPLDVFDRYVRWTLEAYPSAQATPQSQLHTLLERATKAFINSAQYKNDPRYLKLWMHYIHFFSDAPRETYMFLSRHSIGEGLALFYEEYAEWLESSEKWAQAEEVYKLGIEREARPIQRLLRKFKEFEDRLAKQPDVMARPSSPALPTVRPALAAKLDPFESVQVADSQSQRQGSSSTSGASSKPTKQKLAIFSDADAKPSAMSSRGVESHGWDTIGSLSDRKKENTTEPRPWVGETLKAGGKKTAAAKMAVFKDTSLSQIDNITVVPSKNQVTVHPQTGKRESIFVDLAAIYPTPEEPGTELGFEEIVAANRGWLNHFKDDSIVDDSFHSDPTPSAHSIAEISREVVHKLVIHRDTSLIDENGIARNEHPGPRINKKKKVIEVNETQVIKAKLDSPSGPKLRKKNTSEPTMTLHTKAATDDIYEIFNAPLREASEEGNDSVGEDDYETDGDYTTDGESTGTTKLIGTSDHEDEETADIKNVSEWSDFSVHKDILSNLAGDRYEEPGTEYDDLVGDAGGQRDVADLFNATNAGSEGNWSGNSDIDDQAAEESPPRTRTIFVPIPPEDYEPPTRPYRDPVEVANNRLPFMTPITERTESSLDIEAERIDQFKTPCKRDNDDVAMDDDLDLEPFSSPLQDVVISNKHPMPRISAPLAPSLAAYNRRVSKEQSTTISGPIIKDSQCNPADEGVREEILCNMQPPLDAYRGFYDHRAEKYMRGGEIRKFAKAMSKASRASGVEKTGPVPTPVMVEFPDTSARYALRRELGAGAYAPVYLIENLAPVDDDNCEDAAIAMGKRAFAVSRRSNLEALKMETPPSAWEFHIMRLAHSRLGPQHRASASLSYAHEMHLYEDEAFLVLPFHPHGTLLEVVNLFRPEPSGVMDEQLVMFFAIELIRTVEALHAKNLLHGDLKADNCLLRLDTNTPEHVVSSQWRADGSGGWSSRGVVLVDFGRGIDMNSFIPDVEFIADWKTSSQDCAEIREGRPWTWQIDYHGLAGIIHCLLFGKYIETARCDQGGLGRVGRRYKIRESLKRYWETDLWNDCFDVLLNPVSFMHVENNGKMPILKSVKAVRERMEAWLEANCERGIGLRSLIGKLEIFAKNRR